MDKNSMRRPEVTSPEARNALRISLIALPATVITASFYLYLALTLHAWQLYAWSADIWVLALAVLISWVMIRRGQMVRGVWLILAAIQATFIGAVALIEGTGLLFGISIGALVAVIAGQTLSAKSASRATILGLVSGVLAVLLDQFLPAYRLPQPEQTRVVVPIILAVVILLFGYVTMRQFRNYSLRSKMIISFVAITLVSISIIGLISNSIFSKRSNEQVGTNLSAVTQSVAREIAQFVDDDINTLSSLSLNKFIQDTVTTANVAGTSNQSALDRLDQQWINAADNDPLITGVLKNELADDLVEFQSKFPDFLETFVTDRYGAIIASTNRTSDYYQADEDWWQATWKAGTGGVYASQVTFDESVNAYVIDIAVPVYRHNSSAPIGVLRSTININAFSTLTASIELGKTGRAELAFPDNQYIDPDGEGLTKLTSEEVSRLASLPATYGQMTFEGNPSLVSRSLVSAPFSKHNDMIKQLGWTVIVHQSISEAQQSVLATTRTISLAAILLAVVISILAQFLAQFLVGPIARLTAVANQVSGGDLKAQAKVEATDEIGALATAFNKMTSQLRDFIASLESRVAERTSSLVLAANVGRSVSQVRELHLMLKDATELIRSQFDLYYAQVYLLNPTANTLVLEAGTGSVGAELVGRGHRLPLNTASINGRAALEKRSVVISDTSTSKTFRPNPLLPNTRSEMAVPLMVGEKVVGVLDLQSEQPEALSQDILPAFEALAGQLAIAVQNANLLAEAEQARAEVETQARRLVRKNWEEYLDAIHKPEATGFLFEGDKIIPLADATDIAPQAEAKAIEAPISITGEELGSLIVEMNAQDVTPQNAELVNIIARQVAQQIENLRLLESAERYRSEAEQAAHRLTREGWKGYIEAQNRELGYMYDLKEIVPVDGELRIGEAALTLPLKVHDEAVGRLAVMGIEPEDEHAKELAEVVAERLSAHIENLRLYDQSQSALVQSERLFNASRRLTQATNLQELMTETVTSLGISEVNRGLLATFDYDEEGEIERLNIIANWWNGTGHEVTPIGTRYPLEVIRVMPMFISPTPVFFNDTLHDERVDATTMQLVQRLNLRAVAVLPLHLGTRQIGAVILEAEGPHSFTQDEMRLFAALAPQIATVVENRRQFEQTQKQAERESMLNAINQKIQSATTVEAVLQIAARELGHALGAPLTIAQLGMKEPSDNGANLN